MAWPSAAPSTGGGAPDGGHVGGADGGVPSPEVATAQWYGAASTQLAEGRIQCGGPAPPPDPVCAGQTPLSAPAATVAWSTYALGDFAYTGSPQLIGHSLLFAGQVLLEMDRANGKPTWMTYLQAGPVDDATETAGADGRLYLYHPDLEAFDPETHQFNYLEHAVSLTHDLGGPPLVLPTGEVILQDNRGTVTFLHPMPGTHHYSVVWRRQEGLGPQGIVPEGADPNDAYRLAYDPVRRLVYVNATGPTPAASATVALEVETGRERWRTQGPGLELALFGTGELVRWTYLGGRDAATADRVQLLDRADGQVSHDYGPADLVSASSAADRVYVTWWKTGPGGGRTGQSTLTALDSSLKPLWTFTTPAAQPYTVRGGRQVTDGTIAAQPAVGPDGTVYLTTRRCDVLAVGPNGSLRWGDRSPYRFGQVDPVLGPHRLYVVSQFPVPMPMVCQLKPWETGAFFFGMSIVRAYDLGTGATGGGTRDGGP